MIYFPIRSQNISYDSLEFLLVNAGSEGILSVTNLDVDLVLLDSLVLLLIVSG